MSIPDSPQPCHQPSASRSWLVAAMVFVAGVTIGVHWPCVRNGFLDWDDTRYVESLRQHPQLSWSTIRWAFGRTGHDYYSPLTWLTYVADIHHHEISPYAFHRTSVVLHGVNAALVVALSWLILQMAGPRRNDHWVIAGVTGLIFGIHPVQVESVAWVAERKTVLCGCFCLLGALAYLRAVGGLKRRLGWWFMVLAATAAALLAKPMAVSLPVALVALDLYPLRRFDRARWKTCLNEKLILFALAVVGGWLTYYSVKQVGAMEALGAVSATERMGIAARGFGFYLEKLLWPVRLSPFYPFDGTMRLTRPDVMLGLALVGVVVGTCVLLYRRRPAWAATGMWVGAFLLPVSGLMQVGAQAAADRYLYLPVGAVVLLVIGGLAAAYRRFGIPGRAAVASLVVCYCLFLGYRSRAQIAAWRNDETLWRTAFRYYPDSGMINRQLATALQREGKLREALVYAQRTVVVAPEVADAHETLGILYADLRRCPEALAELEIALHLDPTDQRALYFLARCQIQLEQPQQALHTLQRLVELNPQLAASLRQDPAFAELAGKF